MDLRALEKAFSRLRRMSASFEILTTARDAETIENAWIDFLMAAGTFYTALEQGAKQSPASRRWFERKKYERRSDPLLQYVHQARNSEEHGLERVIEISSTHIKLNRPGASVTLESDGVSKWKVVSGEDQVEFANDVLTLTPVRNTKFGDVFQPPTSHAGADIPNASVISVVALALSYFQGMASEAAALRT